MLTKEWPSSLLGRVSPGKHAAPIHCARGMGSGRDLGDSRRSASVRKPRQSDIARRKALGWTPQTDYWQRKAVVFEAVERSGRIKASVVPNSRASVIEPKAREYVLPGSMVFTDEYPVYKRLGKAGYRHRRINHHARVYVDGDVHTQTMTASLACSRRESGERTTLSRTSGSRAI